MTTRLHYSAVYALRSTVPSATWAQIGEGLVRCKATVLNYFAIGGLELLIALEPANVAEFQTITKPYEFRYRSPTFFNNGTARPLYATPEDELAKRLTPAAQRWARDVASDDDLRAKGLAVG